MTEPYLRQNRHIGHARVKTCGQTLDAQLERLRTAGCTRRNIYREKMTGAWAHRRELLKMLKALAPGDIVPVTRVDRLARSMFDLFAIVKPAEQPWNRVRKAGSCYASRSMFE
jgi:DNA invertase Pin-like site-specific DNA recombinase